MITIAVMYSCTLCGLFDVTVHVPARPLDADVVEWMKQTISYVGDNHRHRSPTCQTKTLDNLKIPMVGADWIGGPPIQ